jgi:hypothetical protein
MSNYPKLAMPENFSIGKNREAVVTTQITS